VRVLANCRAGYPAAG